ncbi:MAG: hypothetical protein WAV89_12095 [Ignavibacteriaceae bacterium]
MEVILLQKQLKKFAHLAITKDLELKIIIASKPAEEAAYLKDNLTAYLKVMNCKIFLLIQKWKILSMLRTTI